MSRTTDNDFDNRTACNYSTDSSYNYNDTRWMDLGLSKAEITTVYNICRKFINRRDELEDLLQVAAIELWVTFEKYKDRNIPIVYRTSFIRRVVMSIIIQKYLRKTRKDLIYSTTDFEDYLSSTNEQHYVGSICGARQDKRIDVNLVEDVMLTILNRDDHIIAHYYFSLGFTQAEIAEIIGKSQSVISTKLSVIREKLQEVLKEFNENDRP